MIRSRNGDDEQAKKKVSDREIIRHQKKSVIFYFSETSTPLLLFNVPSLKSMDPD